MHRWQAGRLELRDDCDIAPARLLAADSWLVDDGRALAIDLHRRRFLAAVPAEFDALDPERFWDAAIAAVPRDGRRFPRVDARLSEVTRGEWVPQLLFRDRVAPEARRAITLATHRGRDPRTAPRVKGPDLEALLRLRTLAQRLGADEAVILDAEGAVADGATTCLVWWRDDVLCLPDPSIARVDSVTVRSLLALASALGVEVRHERAGLDDLEGLEVWALNALHGIRIVTSWLDGPATAELPGRLELWRRRLSALGKPLPLS